MVQCIRTLAVQGSHHTTGLDAGLRPPREPDPGGVPHEGSRRMVGQAVVDLLGAEARSPLIGQPNCSTVRLDTGGCRAPPPQPPPARSEYVTSSWLVVLLLSVAAEVDGLQSLSGI
jgi:hypothetical protein